MKVLLVIPPAAALLVVMSWNLSQWRAVAAQQRKSGDLRDRLEVVKMAKAGSYAEVSPNRGSQLGISGPLDWDDLSARLKHIRSSGKISELQEIADLNKRLAEMSREEIVAALEEISAMGLTDEERRPLEDLLVGPLVAVDPELALAKFSNRLDDESGEVSSQLATALQSWAMANPADASSWLDRQIQAGHFESTSLDGRSDARLEFEAALVGELLASDPSAASMRIAALPEDQRREVLGQIAFPALDDAAQQVYVDLMRGLVPKDENAGCLTHIISELVPEGGYDKVSAFLDQIHATPEEREYSARQAANSHLGALSYERALMREDVDSMRAWLTVQSPRNVDSVTGETLGEVVQDGGKLSFQDASQLVLDYQKSSGNDDVLVAFLRSFAARSNLEQAASLAKLVKDPTVRQEILNGLN